MSDETETILAPEAAAEVEAEVEGSETAAPGVEASPGNIPPAALTPADASPAEASSPDAGAAQSTVDHEPPLTPRFVSGFAEVVGRHGLGQALGYLSSRRDRRYKPLAREFVSKLGARLKQAGLTEAEFADCSAVIGWIGSVDGLAMLAATSAASQALSEIYSELHRETEHAAALAGPVEHV